MRDSYFIQKQPIVGWILCRKRIMMNGLKKKKRRKSQWKIALVYSHRHINGTRRFSGKWRDWTEFRWINTFHVHRKHDKLLTMNVVKKYRCKSTTLIPESQMKCRLVLEFKRFRQSFLTFSVLCHRVEGFVSWKTCDFMHDKDEQRADRQWIRSYRQIVFAASQSYYKFSVLFGLNVVAQEHN